MSSEELARYRIVTIAINAYIFKENRDKVRQHHGGMNLSGKGSGLFGGLLFGLSGFVQLLAIFLFSTPYEYLLAIIWGCGFMAGLLISSGLTGYGARGKELYVWGGLFLAGMFSMTITEYIRGIAPIAIGISFGAAILAFLGIFLATVPSSRSY